MTIVDERAPYWPWVATFKIQANERLFEFHSPEHTPESHLSYLAPPAVTYDKSNSTPTSASTRFYLSSFSRTSKAPEIHNATTPTPKVVNHTFLRTTIAPTIPREQFRTTLIRREETQLSFLFTFPECTDADVGTRFTTSKAPPITHKSTYRRLPIAYYARPFPSHPHTATPATHHTIYILLF
ncbi:hypothetical protein CC2G_001934 [Coprinopsis cinerea AmutBmut pab1-1]|nr:hypothetical protein CC2G_001934 [Coprinopsis cinerea AmutBmut pab1-1]